MKIQYPRYHSNCSFRCPFTLQQALSLNAGKRKHLATARHFSSEVMGLMDASCCLSPTGNSLKGYGSGPSSSQPFSYCPQCSTSTLKSQLFSSENTLLYEPHNCIQFLVVEMDKMPVDKCAGLWLNGSNIFKDCDGKFALMGCSREPAVGVSRCGKSWRSDSRVGSVNEQMLQ